MGRLVAIGLQLASLGTMFCASGCIIGFKPASETILTVSPADPGSRTAPMNFGMEYVYWDQLDHGYGVVGTSDHPRDHEAYFFLGYDHYSNSPYCVERRMILITPLGAAAEDGKTYRLEWSIEPLRRVDGPPQWPREGRFAAAVGPPAVEGDTIHFDLKNVPVEGPGPERLVLSGRVVAHKTSLDRFEDWLSQWNERLRREAERCLERERH
jgi:hypothetical protein